MFPYLDNALNILWLQNSASVSSTTTPTGVDLVNAVGPVAITAANPASGSGTLALQPVMSVDNTTWVNVPADAILDPITGLQTTMANLTSAGGTQVVYLKRDELSRYVSLTETITPTASLTVSVQVEYLRAYTSQAI